MYPSLIDVTVSKKSILSVDIYIFFLKFNAVEQSGYPMTTVPHTCEPSLALGTMFLERRGRSAEKLYVTFRFQFLVSQ